jgi:hypothetical protein
VAIGAYGNSILVTTTGLPYVVTGTQPGQLSVEKLERGESCILQRGLVDMGYACIYPGPSGLWQAGTGAVDLITARLMDKKEWQTFSATMTFAVQYGALYIGFMQSGGFILDTQTGSLSTHTVTATAGWYDREEGRLYLVVAGAIVEWGAGSESALLWKSKKFEAVSSSSLGAGQIKADGPVELRVYGDGELLHTEVQETADRTPFRLSDDCVAGQWELEVLADCEVHAIHVASSVSELSNLY